MSFGVERDFIDLCFPIGPYHEHEERLAGGAGALWLPNTRKFGSEQATGRSFAGRQHWPSFSFFLAFFWSSPLAETRMVAMGGSSIGQQQWVLNKADLNF